MAAIDGGQPSRSPTPSSPVPSVSDSGTQLDRTATSTSLLDTHSELPSPSASTFFRTAATLQGLAKQLEELQAETTDDGGEGEAGDKCCCSAATGGAGCTIAKEREKIEDKLKLSAEIGHALLQRYEALEKKHLREVEKYERQLEVKRTALAESVRRVNNLEKANATHMTRYAEISRKNEALEKRYTQALHTQTLTQQSLTHVRAELTSLRGRMNRQSVALADRGGAEEKLAEMEAKMEDVRDQYDAERRKARDEARRGKRLEARIAELEGQLAVKAREVNAAKEIRAKDAQDLLANAKTRLEELHAELSETFAAESPADAPEYQKTLEDLVASNALLKHDASELSHLLADSRDEVRLLREEVDDLRSITTASGRTSPEATLASRRLASEIARSHSHSRTESTPNAGSGHGDRSSWSRMSVHVPSSNRFYEHHRRTSLAPSFASTSTTGEGGLMSPVGLGRIGEYGSDPAEALSPSGLAAPSEGNQSPRQIIRSSPNGGIGYTINGVPKVNLARPPVNRRPSSDRPRPIRTIAVANSATNAEAYANAIAGDSPNPGMVTSPTGDEPQSPAGSEYFRSAEASRKRRSLMLSRAGTRESVDYPGGIYPSDFDLASPISDVAGGMSPKDARRVNRRTLLLLTKSVGTQTDDGEESHPGPAPTASDVTSPRPNTTTNTDGAQSETSSIHTSAGIITALVEHLVKVLTKLRSADVYTLNKRLKKQHIAGGDVGHLSRSTMKTLQADVAELRHAFKGVHEIPNVGKREFAMLLKLLRDTFGELIELQAVINDVTIDPHLAKRMRKEAFRSEEEMEGQKASGGLGWIAAPIAKLFVGPSEGAEAGGESGSGQRGPKAGERGRSQGVGSAVKAPKILASTSATTTHVSVEFGGSGIVRRATPAVPAQTTVDPEGLPPSPDPTMDAMSRQQSTHSGSSGDGTLAPQRKSNTVRSSKNTRANRNELLGIFAGTAPRAASSGGNWVVLGSSPSNPPDVRTLRSSSSRYFADKSPNASKRRLPTAVDAVIDRTAAQIGDDDPATVGSYQPPLLERQLRPRGLSDSSIRSTFISHENLPVVPGTTGMDTGPSQRMGAFSPREGMGYLESFASRFYPFKSSEPAKQQEDEAAPDQDQDEVIEEDDEPSAQPISVQITAPSPAKPIAATSTRAQTHHSRSFGVSPTAFGTSPSAALGQSMTQNSGLLGRLATSISTRVDDDEHDDEDPEMRAQRLQRASSRRAAPRAGLT